MNNRCAHCGHDLAAGSLACEQCHMLVHADELNRLAAAAKDFEAGGKYRDAREMWTQALTLLPRDSQQWQAIRQHVADLGKQAPAANAPKSDNKWAKRLGPLAPLAALLAKGKAVLLAIFKLKSLLSLLAFLWVYCVLFGYKFGLGFAAMILIHEMGHFVDIKRRGLPADMPVFLPGLGAYVKWEAMGVSVETRSAVSLAGPLAGWIAAAVCAVVWVKTGNPLWAALARAGAWLNVINLIPVSILDGGHAAPAIGRAGRFLLLTASLGMWLFLDETVFFLVAAGFAWRLFSKDIPEQSSSKITAYYVAVLAGLALVMRLMPGHGFAAK